MTVPDLVGNHCKHKNLPSYLRAQHRENEETSEKLSRALTNLEQLLEKLGDDTKNDLKRVQDETDKKVKKQVDDLR